jgi:hypothetical protein
MIYGLKILTFQAVMCLNSLAIFIEYTLACIQSEVLSFLAKLAPPMQPKPNICVHFWITFITKNFVIPTFL